MQKNQRKQKRPRKSHQQVSQLTIFKPKQQHQTGSCHYHADHKGGLPEIHLMQFGRNNNEARRIRRVGGQVVIPVFAGDRKTRPHQ